MKKSLLLTGLFTLFAVGLFAQTQQTPAAKSKAAISVDKEMHDYGNIEKGANGTCEFVITNTGTEPLIIERAKGSCGCTVPDWPREPIKPGASATMKVKYDSNRVGPISKSVTIFSNASNTPQKVVRIMGKVMAPASAPVKKDSQPMVPKN